MPTSRLVAVREARFPLLPWGAFNTPVITEVQRDLHGMVATWSGHGDGCLKHEP